MDGHDLFGCMITNINRSMTNHQFFSECTNSHGARPSKKYSVVYGGLRWHENKALENEWLVKMVVFHFHESGMRYHGKEWQGMRVWYDILLFYTLPLYGTNNLFVPFRSNIPHTCPIMSLKLACMAALAGLNCIDDWCSGPRGWAEKSKQPWMTVNMETCKKIKIWQHCNKWLATCRRLTCRTSRDVLKTIGMLHL